MKLALLDTDACIEIIRGNPAPLRVLPSALFAISTVTRFEILSGLRGRKGTKIETRAKAFLRAADTRVFNETAADHAANIRIELESSGCRIGAYDLLIAGHAISLRLPLLTGNIEEYQRVSGLQVIDWRNLKEKS